MHYKGEWWIEGFEENKITGELSLNRKKISDSYLSIAKEFQTNQTGHDYPPKEEDQLFYPKTIYGNIPQVGNVSLYGCFLTGHPKYYNSLYNVYSFQQIALGIICNNIDEIKVKSICCKMNGINTWYPKSFFRYKGLGSKTFTLEQCIPNSQILISEINSVKIKIYLVLSSRRNMRKQSKKSISIKYAVLFESEKETSFHELFFYIRYSKYLFSILIGSPLKSGKYQSKDESGINSRKDIQFYLTEINNSGRKFSILEIFNTYNEDMIDIYINKYFELIRITEMNAVVLNIIEILNTTNKFTQEVFILILKTIELIFEYKYNQKFTYLDNEDFLEFTSNFKDFLDRLQLSNHHDSKYKEVFNKKIININQYSLRSKLEFFFKNINSSFLSNGIIKNVKKYSNKISERRNKMTHSFVEFDKSEAEDMYHDIGVLEITVLLFIYKELGIDINNPILTERIEQYYFSHYYNSFII